MYKNVLFDLDGTITDSAEGIKNCIIYACKKMNLTVPSEDVLRSFIGPPLNEHMAKVFSLSCDDAEKMVAIYRARYAPKGIFENKLYDGVDSMLLRLKNEGCKIALATSKPQVFAEQIIGHFSLSSYFDLIVGSTFSEIRNNKTAVISEAISKLGGPLESFIMVGDRHFDIDSSNELKIDSIGVTYGYGSRDELILANPTYLAHSPSIVADIILK